MRTMKMMVVAAAVCASAMVFAKDAKVIRLSDFVKKVDERNLAALPIGKTLAAEGIEPSSTGKGVSKVSVQVDPAARAAADCAALCVSEVFVDGKTMEIKGGLGSNVYPTVAEGVFAMTNQIVAAVMKASSGKASVTPLKMNSEKGYGEVKFFWTRKSGGVSELLVRGYVNARRQMTVCTFLHTQGDGIGLSLGSLVGLSVKLIKS